MKNINWKVRFSKDNILFWVRFAIAVLAPAMAYLALDPQDLSTWDGLIKFLTAIVANPYLIGITIVNALNLIPDPTTPSLSDSERVLNKTSVKD